MTRIAKEHFVKVSDYMLKLLGIDLRMFDVALFLFHVSCNKQEKKIRVL